MPDYVDVNRLIVRANRAPEVYAPSQVTVYEGRTVNFNVSVTVGYPIMNNFSHVLQNNARNPVSEGGSNPDVQYTELDWSTFPANAGGLQPVRVVAPTLPGNSPLYVDYYVVFTVTSTFGTDTSTTRVRVSQSVTASISIAQNHSAYEMTSFSAPIMYNAGSPVSAQIRHSFHNSLSDANAGRNARTSGRPDVTISPSQSQLSALSGQSVRDRDGTITYDSDLPAVTSDTNWYGRVEIVQNGNVVDSATYTLTIRNAVSPTINISSGEAIEGHYLNVPFNYTAGAPYANQFSHVGFYNSQNDAQNNRNRLTSADRIPSSIVFSPTSPGQRTGLQSGSIRMLLPYVDADKRIYGLVRISRDDGEGNVLNWQGTYYIDILNRVPAQIDIQEVITMDEESTLMVMFSYTRGVPAARGYGVSVHESQSDADNDRNPVMDSDDPRITLSAYDNSGGYTSQKSGVATIVTPDIGSSDRSWYPRFEMDQDTITPDP